MIIRCKNLALYIRDCVSLCLSDETLKAVGPCHDMFLILFWLPADYTCNSSNNTLNQHVHIVFSVCLYQIHLIYVIHNDNKHDMVSERYELRLQVKKLIYNSIPCYKIIIDFATMLQSNGR